MYSDSTLWGISGSVAENLNAQRMIQHEFKLSALSTKILDWKERSLERSASTSNLAGRENRKQEERKRKAAQQADEGQRTSKLQRNRAKSNQATRTKSEDATGAQSPEGVGTVESII